jgi:transposase
MRYIGMDVHSRQTYFCVVDSQGKKLSKGKIATAEEGLKGLIREHLGRGDEVRVAVEASTITWWVQDVLSRAGAEVEVTNPYKLKLISESRSKTDKRDADILAELLRCGGLPTAVYVPSVEIMRLRKHLTLRRRLVRIRTQLINSGKSYLRGYGIQSKVRDFHSASSWSDCLTKHTEHRWYLSPLMGVYGQIRDQLEIVESDLREKYGKNEYVTKLQEIPGIGITVAYTIVSAIGEPSRFATTKQVAAYAGLVPSERSSGENIVRGGITHEGRNELRQMMVQAAWAVLRTRRDEASELKRFYYRIMHKKGSQIAIVALARKLLTIAYQVMRSGQFNSEELGRRDAKTNLRSKEVAA